MLRVLEDHERLVVEHPGKTNSHVSCACLETFRTVEDHRRHVLNSLRAVTTRRRTVDDALLRAVAKTWKKTPEGARRRAVADEVGCSLASAGAYIATARKRGFLPAATARTARTRGV